MKRSKIVFLYVTCSSKKEASELAHVLVRKRLAACANILPQMKSVYHWKGKIAEASEAVLLVKTKRELSEKVSKFLAMNHSYETPCVLELPLARSNPTYEKWFVSQFHH
jgi:periplasmic divalent cation tolerance protein